MCSSPGWSIFLLGKAHLSPCSPVIWLHALLSQSLQSLSLLKISTFPLPPLVSPFSLWARISSIFTDKAKHTHKNPSYHQVHIHQSLWFSFLSNFYKPSIFLLSLFISHSLINSLFSGSAILVTYKLSNFMNIHLIGSLSMIHGSADYFLFSYIYLWAL